MKTPEELAEEFAEMFAPEPRKTVAKKSWWAGYQAAKEHAHAALEEAEARIQELRDQLMEESGGRLKLFKNDADAKTAYQEALEDADTCEHILDMSKMVDVSSSATLNNWISVKDRLPKINKRMSEDVLILDEFGEMSVEPFEIVNNEIVVDWGEAGLRPLSDFTHWMPLPEPPKEEK
jgi:hypothetical protein